MLIQKKQSNKKIYILISIIFASLLITLFIVYKIIFPTSSDATDLMEFSSNRLLEQDIKTEFDQTLISDPRYSSLKEFIKTSSDPGEKGKIDPFKSF